MFPRRHLSVWLEDDTLRFRVLSVEEEGRDMARWTQRRLDRYFAEACVRESLRIRRETPAPGP